MGPEGERREVREHDPWNRIPLPPPIPARAELIRAPSIKDLLGSDREDARFSALLSLRQQPEFFKAHEQEILRRIAADPENKFTLGVLHLFTEKSIPLSEATHVVDRVLEYVTDPEYLSVALDLLADWKEGAQAVRLRLAKIVVGSQRSLSPKAAAVLICHGLVDTSVLHELFDGLTPGIGNVAESRAVDCIAASTVIPARLFEILTSHIEHGDEIRAVVAIQAATALSSRGGWLPSCVATIALGLERVSDMVREESAKSLGALGHRASAAIEKLGSALERSPEVGIRRELLAALHAVGGEVRAFRSLCRAAMLESDVDNIGQLLLLIRKGAISAESSALSEVAPLFSHRSDDVRAAAESIFQEENIPAELCIRVLSSGVSRAMEAALFALARKRRLVEFPKSELLRSFLTGEDPSLCNATLSLLSSFPREGGDLFPAILYVVADSTANDSLRMLALSTAKQRGPRSARELDALILCFEDPKQLPSALRLGLIQWISRFDDRAQSLSSIARWVADLHEIVVSSQDQGQIAQRSADLVREYGRGLFSLAYGLQGLESASRVLDHSGVVPSHLLRIALDEVLGGWKARFLRWIL